MESLNPEPSEKVEHLDKLSISGKVSDEGRLQKMNLLKMDNKLFGCKIIPWNKNQIQSFHSIRDPLLFLLHEIMQSGQNILAVKYFDMNSESRHRGWTFSKFWTLGDISRKTMQDY